MKTIYNKFLWATLGILMTLFNSGCKKEKLSPVPGTTLPESLAFSTPDRIRNEVFGVYSAAKNGNFLGGRGIVYNDVRGEDWLNITGNGVTATGVWNFSINSSDNQVENFWSTGYATINRANVVLEGIDANAALLSPSVANNYRGEVRFARAISYFYLLNLYGRKPYNADGGVSPGIPLRLKAYKKASDTASMARSTVAQVYDQILADLNFAEQNLPLTYGTATDSNLVRAHRNAAIAFKSRVYLHMGKYPEVITEANKLIPLTAPYQAATGVANRLESDITTVFRSFTSSANRETFFAFPMTQTNAPGTQNGLALYHNAEFALNPSGILGNAQLGPDDVRRKNFVVNTTAPFRYSKYNDDNNNYVQIIRYAEVMLNLAEALARLNPAVDARAVQLLNAVHKRSDPATTLAPATQQELIDMILTERRIELLGEGLRSLDIMRQVIPFPAKGAVSAVPPSSVSYVWPIPASELIYNKLMVPNQ